MTILKTWTDGRSAPELLVERVAGRADGADRVFLALVVQRLAETADMDVDGARLDIDVRAPDRIEQLLAELKTQRGASSV